MKTSPGPKNMNIYEKNRHLLQFFELDWKFKNSTKIQSLQVLINGLHKTVTALQSTSYSPLLLTPLIYFSNNQNHAKIMVKS